MMGDRIWKPFFLFQLIYGMPGDENCAMKITGSGDAKKAVYKDVSRPSQVPSLTTAISFRC